jgi:hypothetical protein
MAIWWISWWWQACAFFLQGESARVLWMAVAWAGVLVMEKGFLPFFFFFLEEKKSTEL